MRDRARATMLFREGEPADYWWVLVDGRVELVRARRPRGDGASGAMDVPGPVGRRVPGLGRARRLPRHRPRRRRRPGAAGARRACCATGCRRGSRSAVHLIGGLYRTARSIESTARQRERWSRSARWPPGSPTSSTTRPPRRAARSTRSRTTCDDAAGRRWAASAERRSRRAEQFAALDGLRRAAGRGRPRAPTRWPLADREEELAGWLDAPRRRRPWRLAGPLAAAGADVAWCEQVAELVPPGGPGAGAGWVASTLPRSGCSPRSGGHRAGSPSWWPRSGPTPRSTARPCSRSTSPTASRAPW